MQTRNAIRLALIFSGKYDLPEKMVVKGRDMYGNETSEEGDYVLDNGRKCKT